MGTAGRAGRRLAKALGRLRHRIGRRGAFLGFLAVLDVVFGWYLLNPAVPNQPGQFPLLPPQAWAAWWLGTAGACLVGMFLITDRVAYALAAFLKTAWGLRYAYLWWMGVAESWAALTIWLVFAFIVVVVAGWPEEVSLPPGVRRDDVHAG